MNIIIDQGDKQRKITGSFQMYGSGADLLCIASQIEAQVEQNKIDYGWVSIPEETMTAVTVVSVPEECPPTEKSVLDWEK